MKTNSLLILSLLAASSLPASAQVLFNEGFNAEQTKTATDVGFYTYINQFEGDKWQITNDASNVQEGDGALQFYNSDTQEGHTWERQVQFRNLKIENNTSYRVTYYIKGSPTYNLDGTADKTTHVDCKLMQGVVNYDIPFVSKNGTAFRYDDTGFNNDGYKKFTHMFYFSNPDIQAQYFTKLNYSGIEQPDSVKDKFFLALSVYNPGDFYLDNVTVEKADIQGVTFNYDVIRVNFGYGTNYKDLLKAAGVDKLVYPDGCATVTLNGQQVKVLTTELHSDGYLYVFLDDQYPESGDDKISVSFNNPTDPAYQLKYSGDMAPEGVVPNFTNEEGSLDENITDVYSSAYDLPLLKSADPENGSFNLPLDTKTFKVTFNKKADASKIKATLGSEPLTVSPSEGYATDFTLTRTGSGDLTAGEYTLNVTNVFPVKVLDESTFTNLDLTLNFGKVVADPSDTARTVMQDSIATYIAKGEGTVPMGWQVFNGANQVAEGTNPGSGPRSFKFADGGDFTSALYLRTAGANDGGCGIYGKDEGYKLTLEAGKKYRINYNTAAWKGTPYCKFELIGPDGNDVISRVDACVPNMNGQKSAIVGSTAVEINFKPENNGDYVMKWTPAAQADGTQGAWIEILLGNVSVKYIPNVAGVVEVTALNDALAKAKAVRDANAADRYKGTAVDKLNETITAYDGKSFTAPSIYKKAVEELNEACKAVNDHRALCDAYDPLVDKAKAELGNWTETKFKNHPAYPALEAAIAKYDGKVLYDDAELTAAIKELTDATFYLNAANHVSAALMNGINSGMATVKKLNADNDGLENAVNNCMTDDDNLRSTVMGTIKQAIYQDLAKGSASTLFESKVDTVTLENYVDSFDMSVFVKNPNFYYVYNSAYGTNMTDNTKAVNSETLPGWTVTAGDGWSDGLTYHYPWGGNQTYKNVTATNPAEDGMIASWARAVKVEQKIVNLPAGIYNVFAAATERGDSLGAFLKVETSTMTDSVQLVKAGAGTEPGESNGSYIKGVKVNDGTLTISLFGKSVNQPFFNYVRLVMVNKSDDFNYATGIRNVKADDNASVVRTEYFDLAGRRVQQVSGRGITIVKQTLSDGTVRTKKVQK